MADKKFTIALEGKVAPSVQKVLTTMESFQAAGVKMSKAMQTLSGQGGPGSGPPGAGALAQGGIAKGLLAQQKLFESLGVSGTKLAKVLNEQVTRAQVNLQKSLQVNAKSFGPLIKQYEAAHDRVAQLQAAGADPARIALAQKYAARAGGAVGGAAELHRQLLEAQGGLGDGTPSPPGTPGAGGGRAFGANLVGMMAGRAGVPYGSMIAGLGSTGMVVAGVAAAALVVLKTISSVQKGDVAQGAMLGGAQSAMFQRGISNDTRYLVGREAVAADPSRIADLDSELSFTKHWRGFASALSAGTQIFKGYDAYNTAFQKEYQARRLNDIAERYGDIGAEMGPAADIADKQFAQAPTIRMMRRRFGAGSWGRSNDLGVKYDIGGEAIRGYMTGLAPMTGHWGAESGAARVAALEAQGVDPARAMAIVGRTMVGRGNALAGTGRFDPAMRAIIGEGVAGTMGIESAMWGGKGTAMAERLSGGGITAEGGAMGVFQANQAVAGASMAGRLFGGHDAYQKSYNIAASSAALGGGADPYQRQALASLMADPAILSAVLANQLPPALAAMGITLDQAKAFAKDVDRSTVSRWVDSGGTYAAAGHMRKAAKMGGARQYLESIKDPKAREQAFQEMAPLLAQTEEALTGGTVGGAVSLQRFLAGGAATGVKKAGKKGKGPDWDDAEQVLLDRQHESLNKLNETVNNLNGRMEKAGEVVTTYTELHIKAAKAIQKSSPELKGGKRIEPAGGR